MNKCLHPRQNRRKTTKNTVYSIFTLSLKKTVLITAGEGVFSSQVVFEYPLKNGIKSERRHYR